MEFIAEIGLNHNGNFGLIPELIKQAAYSGADFAKFQLGWRDKKGEINALQSNDLIQIFRYCEYYCIKPLFSVIHEEAWKLLTDVTKSICTVKIASRTLVENHSLIEKITESVPRVIISTGMINKSKLNEYKYINAEYLWCQSKYPLHTFDIEEFPLSFSEKTFVGISDHTIDLSLSLISICRGATLIERHFTLDKSDNTIRDHALSSTPSEFTTLVRTGREIYRTINLINNKR